MLWKYLKNILISIDQLGNAIAFGSPDETISSRLGRNYRGSPMEVFVDWLFSWTGTLEHCEDSVESVDREDGALMK